MANTFVGLLAFLVLITNALAQTKALRAFGPVPTENQMRWQEMEYYAFVHFSTNTFTDMEWGYGDDDPKIFNPTNLDCRQWAKVCKQAGMKGIIVTAKHHSGFCLWPSRYTEYSVKNSPWKNGKGDVVADLSKACKEYGLKLGIYLSPWDRNSAVYGRGEYITYFRNQLQELLTNYGDIFEIWFDGANGGSGYYGGENAIRKIDRTTYYDWKNTYSLIRKLQPEIVIWNDGGDRADLRWVGTEAGYVGETNWSLLNATGNVSKDMLQHGLENGDAWVPGEVNTSIRPGWFYHAHEDNKVKTLPELVNLYYNSIGRNGTLLLNFPIDRRGLIHETDAQNSLELANTIKAAFAVNLAANARASASSVWNDDKQYKPSNAIDPNNKSYWVANEQDKTPWLIIDFGKPTPCNNFLIQEYVRLGQRVKAFKVEAFVDQKWKEIIQQTTIGYKRILRFPTITTSKLRVTITESKASPVISTIGIYHSPQLLSPPVISRNKEGEVHITAEDKESTVFYTLDGTKPTKTSMRYSQPFSTSGKLNIKAIAYDVNTGQSSRMSEGNFDITHQQWKVIGIDDSDSNNVIDGNSTSAWYHPNDKKMPLDLILDLGKMERLQGFKYLPGQSSMKGVVSNYQFFVSDNCKDWSLIDQGEFANIQNSPTWQLKSFLPVKARYIKLRALQNTQNNDAAGYAEIDVITGD